MLPFLPCARRVRTCAMRLRVCRVLHGRLHFGSAVPARVRGVPKIGVPGVSCVAWKVEVLGPSGMLRGFCAPGLSGKRAVSGSLRSAPSCSRVLAFPVSRFFPHPGFPRVPVSSVYRFLGPGGRRRIPGCRIGGCIVLFRFILMRNPKKRRKLRNPCFVPWLETGAESASFMPVSAFPNLYNILYGVFIK